MLQPGGMWPRVYRANGGFVGSDRPSNGTNTSKVHVVMWAMYGWYLICVSLIYILVKETSFIQIYKKRTTWSILDLTTELCLL